MLTPIVVQALHSIFRGYCSWRNSRIFLACSRSLTSLLRATSKSIGLPGIHDSTVYGTSRASPRSYFGHHLAAISASVVVSDANTLVNHGAALNLTLTIPSPVPNVRAGSSGARHA